MTTLFVKVHTLIGYDFTNSTIQWQLYYDAIDGIYDPGPISYTINQGTLNTGATPPTFPTSDAALAYYNPIAGAQLLSTLNTAYGFTIFSGYDVEPMDSGVSAALASLSTVARTGVYSDLTGKPTIVTPQAYDNITQKTGAFPVYKSGSIASGSLALHFTADGTSTGTALFPNGPITNSVNVIFNDATSSYQCSWAWSNSNKTLTITANKLATANILTGILGQSQANGAVATVTVFGN